MSCARASTPSATPTSRTSAGSHEEPSADAVGKQVAGTLPDKPTSSPRPGCLRSPCGPSDNMIDSTPAELSGAVCQKSEPRHRAAFCSTISALTSAASGSFSAMSYIIPGRAGWRPR